MIVGLTKDGDLRMTGRYAEFMAPEVESWKNIAAVKVGSTAKIEAIVNAVDIDGKFYHLEYDRRWTELVSGVLDPEAGQAEKGAVWYKYAPDGTAYRVRGYRKVEPAKTTADKGWCRMPLFACTQESYRKRKRTRAEPKRASTGCVLASEQGQSSPKTDGGEWGPALLTRPCPILPLFKMGMFLQRRPP